MALIASTAAILAGFVLVQAPGVALALVLLVVLIVVSYATRSGAIAGVALTLLLLSGFVVARGVSADAWTALTASLVMLSFVLLAAHRVAQQRTGERPPIQTLFLVAFLLVAVVHILIALVDGDDARTLLGLRIWCFFALLYWVGRWIADDRRALAGALSCAAIGVAVTLAYGFKQFIFGYTDAELALVDTNKYSVYYMGVPRLASTLPTNQDFAAVLVVVVPALIALAAVGNDKKVRGIAISFLAVAATALAVLGMVRSATVATAFGSLVVLALVARNRRRTVLLVLTTLLAGSFIVQAVLSGTGDQGSAVRSRLLTFTRPAEDPALAARLHVVWPRALRAVAAEPEGHGVATTGGPAIALEGRGTAMIPDNGYLTLAYELGIVGAVLFVAFLLSVAIAARRVVTAPLSRLERGLALAAVGAIASVLVAMLAGSFVQLPTLQALLFPLAGIAVRISERA